MSQNISEIINNMSDDDEHEFVIARNIYSKSKFDCKYLKSEKARFNLNDKFQMLYAKLKSENKKRFFKRQLFNRLPVLKWLIIYNFRQNLVADIISGVTIGIIQVTQG